MLSQLRGEEEGELGGGYRLGDHWIRKRDTEEKTLEGFDTDQTVLYRKRGRERREGKNTVD